MFMKFAQFDAKMANARPEAGGNVGGGTDYGAMMADLFNKMAEKQYQAAVKKEPAKANKTITQG
jgi:molybdenum-dependent DNA-binding transcriptional regulator ModE